MSQRARSQAEAIGATTGAPGLGDLLVRDGLITTQELANALTEQQETHERLGERNREGEKPSNLEAYRNQSGQAPKSALRPSAGVDCPQCGPG